MSASFEIASSTGAYQVQIEPHAFKDYLRRFTNPAIIADKFFAPVLHSIDLPAILVDATEANKSLDASPRLIEQLRKSGATRETELVAVGGGIVQDLASFIASVYMRGLRWSYIPTTVLAMVDSCIGGKSSINVGPYKNLVGTFHPPTRVLIDPSLAQTLPDEQKTGGLIEAAKICFCRGSESFDRYLYCGPSTSMSTEALDAVIISSLESKKWFIEIDEFDKSERLLLNFGHTFGHAIEGASRFAVPHGIAVGLGILCALSFERGNGANYARAPIVQALEDHLQQMLASVPELAERLHAMPLNDFMESFASDKKHGAGYYTLVLVAEDGRVVLRKITRSVGVDDALRDAVQATIDRFAR